MTAYSTGLVNSVRISRAGLVSHLSLLSLLLGLLLTACGTNPVTGERELSFVSETQEVKIGEENYVPSQQSQGGPYVADPRLTPYVKAIGMKLVQVSDRPNLPFDFVVLNNPVPNAWALPGGKIAVNTGLLVELNNEAELAAVIGHEIVHAAARHGAKSMERGMLLQAGVLSLGLALGDKDNADLIVGAAAAGTGLISQKYGRDAESESDLYGMRYMAKAGYNPAAAITLQETFVRLSEGKQANWLEGLFASHPPSQERVEANKKTAAELGAKGFMGDKEYQQQIAHLKQAQPAYKTIAEGQKALKDNNPAKALELADKAIALEPKEALFYSLKGDVYFKQKEFKKADQAYTEAIKNNDRFFLYHLGRGLTREQLKQHAEARIDLQKSVELLPTAPALNALGNLSNTQGDKIQAVQFYKQAATSKSLFGEQAAVSLAKLDLAEHPEDYIEAKAGLTRAGSIGVIITNHSAVKVGNIKIDVAILNSSNNVQQMETYTVNDPIAAGDKQVIETRLFLPGHPQSINVRTKITYARVIE